MCATKKISAKDKAADLRLRRTYGITLEEYGLILKHQKGCCAICKTPVQAGAKRLAVDHCHKTGLVRGLLCMKCNRALGKFEDNNERVTNAALYVTDPPATIALGRTHLTVPGRVGTKKRSKLLNQLAQATKSKQRGL